MRQDYGLEVVVDLHGCKTEKFTREGIEEFMIKLCDRIKMVREDLHFWDYEGLPEEEATAPEHLAGISAVQFITTSNITLHTLDKLRRVYLNIFSCKPFQPNDVIFFCAEFFGGQVANTRTVERI